MNLRRILGSLAVVAVAAAGVLYAVHPAKSSDHQDTYNLANRSNTSADITDVFVFPSPTNAANVVLAMDVSPLIPAGMGAAKFFDPTLMWQFKISHGATSPEDQVIQFGVTGTGASQTITMYGPAKPNEVGPRTRSSHRPVRSLQRRHAAQQRRRKCSQVRAPTRSSSISSRSSRSWAIATMRRTRPRPIPDRRRKGRSTTATTSARRAKFAPAYDKSRDPSKPTFNGFPAGTVSGHRAATRAPRIRSQNALADLGGGFNVLTFVVEVPRVAADQRLQPARPSTCGRRSTRRPEHRDYQHEESVIGLAALGALGFGLAGCNGGIGHAPALNTGSASRDAAADEPDDTDRQRIMQIELLSRPAVKEAFENFNDHKITNKVEPYAGSPADPLQAEIKATEDTLRPPKSTPGGAADYGAALQSILYPNEIAVNLASADKASYLGVETGGATGGKFGGRDINDNVIDISLGAAFGTTLSALNVQPDDGQENNCISKQNVAQAASQQKTGTFPYLAPPH